MKAKFKHPHSEAPWLSLANHKPPIGSEVEVEHGGHNIGNLIWNECAAKTLGEYGRVFWRTPLPPIGSFSLRRKG